MQHAVLLQEKDIEVRFCRGSTDKINKISSFSLISESGYNRYMKMDEDSDLKSDVTRQAWRRRHRWQTRKHESQLLFSLLIVSMLLNIEGKLGSCHSPGSPFPPLETLKEWYNSEINQRKEMDKKKVKQSKTKSHLHEFN